MKIVNKEIKLPDGRVISIETGKLAKQADGSVVVRMGNTMLLAPVGLPGARANHRILKFWLPV
jgi:polyribonucleotide nucleotidyltransferase